MAGLQDKHNKKKRLWTIKSNPLYLKSKQAIHFKHKNLARAQFLSPPQFSTDLQGGKVLKKTHPKNLYVYMISK